MSVEVCEQLVSLRVVPVIPTDQDASAGIAGPRYARMGARRKVWVDLAEVW